MLQARTFPNAEVDPVGGVLLLDSNDADIFSAEQQIHDFKLALAARAATFN